MDSIIEGLLRQPHKLGHLLGRTKLTALHDRWLKEVWADEPRIVAFQAHRGAYKSTMLVELGIPIYLLFHPNCRIALVKETFSQASEQLGVIRKIMKRPQVKAIGKRLYGKVIEETVGRNNTVSWNFRNVLTKEGNLDAYGVGQIPTGTHYDLVVCDDIVTINCLISKAFRDGVNLYTREILNNILDPGGKFILIGTPWHVDDAFNLHEGGDPDKPLIFNKCYKYPVGVTGILSEEEIEEKKRLPASIYSINYELRHLPQESYLFTDPQYGIYPSVPSVGHLDLAFGGKDYTAATTKAFHLGVHHVDGYAEQKHFEQCLPKIAKLFAKRRVMVCYLEDNADKGLSKSLLQKWMPNIAFKYYHETTNKHIKITTILKEHWNLLRFAQDVDLNYMVQITQYTEQADDVDAPDSLASILRSTGSGALSALWGD